MYIWCKNVENLRAKTHLSGGLIKLAFWLFFFTVHTIRIH